MVGNDSSVKKQQRLFLACIGMAVAGGLVGQLGATSATTLAGGVQRGSFDTGIYLTLATLTAALVAPRALGLAGRFGAQTTWAWVNVFHSSLYVFVGLLVLQFDRLRAAGEFGAVVDVRRCDLRPDQRRCRCCCSCCGA